MEINDIKKRIDYVFKDVFGRDNAYDISTFKNKFAYDIPSVKELTCGLSNNKTWGFVPSGVKVASNDSIAERFGKDEWMRSKRSMGSIEEILNAWDEINYQTSEKYINSTDVYESDSIQNSSNIYRSVMIFDSKNIAFSYNLVKCDYVLGSMDNESCTMGIRLKESIYCSSSFEVSWSNKVSKSMFIHDSSDLYECLFCSHLRSKKYCVANMQFTKEEYMVIKAKVIDWILKDN